MTALEVIARAVRDVDRERFATVEDRADAFAAAIIIALNEAGYTIEAVPHEVERAVAPRKYVGFRAGGPNW